MEFKPETKVEFGLSINAQNEILTLADLNVDCSKSEDEIRKKLDDMLRDWAKNFIEYWWKVTEEDK